MTTLSFDGCLRGIINGLPGFAVDAREHHHEPLHGLPSLRGMGSPGRRGVEPLALSRLPLVGLRGRLNLQAFMSGKTFSFRYPRTSYLRCGQCS